MHEWIKAAHVISVIAWMAAMLYLPRLMVYHAVSEAGSKQSETFKIMETRLLRQIMTPAMIATWLFGIWIAIDIRAWEEGWFLAKLALVIGLTAFHGMCGKWVREFTDDQRDRSQRFFRLVNELPAVAMALIVILVIVRPF